MSRHFSLVFLLIAIALAGGAYAADSSSPSPATTSNTTEKSPPATPTGYNSTNGLDYSDYEVPINVAPEGVEVVGDYAPVTPIAGKEADELTQPQGESKQPKSSASSSSSSSSSFIFFVVAIGLFLS